MALTLGESPSIEAGTSGPVLIADLAATSCRARWPAFSSAAVAIGVGATFALPLRAVVALVRPRAYAYANDRSLRDVAQDVVATAAVRT